MFRYNAASCSLSLIVLSLLGFGAPLKASAVTMTYTDLMTFQAAAGPTQFESYEDPPTVATNPNPRTIIDITTTTDSIMMTTSLDPTSPMPPVGTGIGVYSGTNAGGGQHPSDGTQYVSAFDPSGTVFVFDFDTTVTAFALTIIDWGDGACAGTCVLSIQTNASDDTVASEIAQVTTSMLLDDGNEIFFGLTNLLGFTQVTLTSTQTDEGAGFGNAAYSVDAVYFTPEPSTSALLGSGILGLALFGSSSRKQRPRAA